MTGGAREIVWQIPARRNLALCVVSWTAAAGFLSLGSHAEAWWHWLVAGVGFALV